MNDRLRNVMRVSAAPFVVVSLAVSPAAAQTADVSRAWDGHPDLNGVWQAIGTAHWDLQDHPASAGPVDTGAIGAIPPGQGVVVGNEIPYQPQALEQKQQNFENRWTDDPEIKCFMPGVPRATYMPYPFRIIQGDKKIMIVYGFAEANRTIHMDKENPEPAPIDTWLGRSHGLWDGDTLVVDTTNFSPKTDYQGSRENLHLVERWTRLDAETIEYSATMEDPTTWMRPWTVAFELSQQSNEANRFYTEPRCHEGNYGLLNIMRGARTQDAVR